MLKQISKTKTKQLHEIMIKHLVDFNFIWGRNGGGGGGGPRDGKEINYQTTMWLKRGC